ncbi:class D sortase [Salipaludibacillus aurantiacus]|uniref:Sortase A n=1 Tax=Salipaludibacillus aurantiacus TaxID=1601833 RepID=A0A1H9V2Z8_9BACI|nr:class D sortase [Salipaludibacillus aurantiacus]SES16116.1 sortase A [Salipaludibacillus aurantiacus]
MKIKNCFLLLFSTGLIVAGLLFTTTNAYTFLKGYLLYKYSEPASYLFAAETVKEHPVPVSGMTAKREAVLEEKIDTANSQGSMKTASSSSAPKEKKDNMKVTEPGHVVYAERPGAGEEFAYLTIPKLNATFPVYHGTDDKTLEKGVGHYPGSVLPGENDNSVLSGHRDTVFRELGKVGEKDLLIVTTSAGEFTYKVKRVRIVDADDRTVIVPRPRATLTVTTCYPFNFIGAAPERYVLEAVLVSN